MSQVVSGKIKNVIYLLSHPIQYYAPLFKEIQENGIDLDVWYCSRHGLEGEMDKEFGTKVKWDIPILDGYSHKFLKNTRKNPSIYHFFGLVNLQIIALLCKKPKSLVIVPGWKHLSYILTIVFARLLGHKVALRAETPLSHELLKTDRKKQIRKYILGFGLFKFCHYFLYIGQQNKEFYKYYGIKDEQLIFAPYAVENKRFIRQKNKLEGTKEILREKNGIKPRQVCFLYSGKYIHKKRPLEILRAFLKMKERDNAFIIFMGEGNLRTEMEKIMEGRDENILLTGFVNQSKVAEFYFMADAFIMCSGSGETWGLSTNEAMNFSLPLILSDLTGSSSDLVEKGSNGWVVPLDDVDAISSKMDEMVKSGKKKRMDMGKESARIVKEYSYQTIIKGISSTLSRS